MSSTVKKIALSKNDESLALEIYVQALELPSDKRRAFLESNAKDARIQLYVENLLSENTRLASFLAVAPALSSECLEPGEMLGNFRVRRTLGHGGLATVYLAHDVVLNRLVALKVSNAPFPHEGRLLASLDHPHIVRVYSQSDSSEKMPHYLCMQYVPGLTLGKCIDAFGKTKHSQINGQKMIGLLDESRQDETVLVESGVVNRQALKELNSVDLVLHLGSQLADALHYAHENQVLHLDVKPENIIINRYGQPMLMDFNVSVTARPNEQQGVIGGTFHYMSPEQKRLFQSGDPSQLLKTVDARSDVYSLGLVLKEFLESVRADQHVPLEVARVLEKATAPDVGVRYQSAQDLKEALASVLLVRRIQSQLPHRFLLGKLGKRAPFLFLGLWGYVPIIGSNRSFRMDLETNIFPHLKPAEVSSLYGIAPFGVVLLVAASVLWTYGVFRLFRQTTKQRVGDNFRPHLLPLSVVIAVVHWLPMLFCFAPYMRSIGMPLAPAVQWDLSVAIVQVMLVEVALNFIFALAVFLWDIYPKILLRTNVTQARLERDLRNIPRAAMVCFFVFAATPWLQLIVRGNPRPIGSVALHESLSMVLGITLTFIIFDWLYLVSRTVDIYLNQRGKR